MYSRRVGGESKESKESVT